MRILAASDLHGDKEAIDRLAKRAKDEKVDLIVLAGDLTFAENDLTGIIGPLKKANKRILIIPGNHETNAAAEFLVEQYKPGVYNIHGRAVVFYDEIGFFGVGSSNIGLFELPEKEVAHLLEKAHRPIKDVKHTIMVAHTPPQGTKLDALWTHVGSEGVRKSIEKFQPDLCVCGHIHETFGKHDQIGKTKIINVGPKGIIINIEKKKN